MGAVEDRWFSEQENSDGETVRVATRRNGRGLRWRAYYREPAGKQKSKSFALKRDADRWLTTIESSKLAGSYTDPALAWRTVTAWCDTWLIGYRTRRKSTVRQAEVHVKLIKAQFGSMPLAAVKPSDVRGWCAKLKADGRADSYVYALHARLAQIFADAVHDGIVPRSPCSRRTSPGAGKQRPYVATTGQVWALHDAVPAGVRPAILLGAHAGLRLAEAAALRPADVDFMRGVISPAVQWPAEPLKSDTSRLPIPIPHEMALALSVTVAAGDGETVVTDEVGRPVAGPWVIERAVRAARGQVPGLPARFRFHDLRHYFASMLIAAGLDVKTVQARMRHASAKTTLDTYSHLWPDRDESSRAAVAALYAARGTAGAAPVLPGLTGSGS
jgi:integrase